MLKLYISKIKCINLKKKAMTKMNNKNYLDKTLFPKVRLNLHKFFPFKEIQILQNLNKFPKCKTN